MARFIVTVQAQLTNNNSGPHFNIALEAESYVDALERAKGPLVAALAESGLAIRSLPLGLAADAASPTPPPPAPAPD